MTDERTEQIPVDDGSTKSVDISQRAVFLTALLPGAIAIAISRVLELTGAYFWIVSVIFPVICMVAYWVANDRGEYFDSTRAQVADNIYFLGFLYFLVSLAATLILFAARELDQSVVIQGFGVALVTTILGLFLRILVLQQSAPIEDSRERAERDLLHEILQTGQSIKAGNEALRQAQDVAITGLAETSRLLAEKAVASSEEINNKIAASVASIEGKLQAINIPADLLTRALRPMLEEMQSAVSHFAQSVHNQAQAGTELATTVRSVTGPLQETADALDSLNRSVEKARPNIEAIGKSIEASAVGTAAVAKSTDAARASMDTLAQSVTALQQRVQALKLDTGLELTAAQIKEMREQLALLKKISEEMVPAIQKAVGAFPVLVNDIRGAALEIKDAAFSTKALVTEVERIQGPEALRQALEGVNAVVTNLRGLEETLVAHIERLRQAPPANSGRGAVEPEIRKPGFWGNIWPRQ